MADATVSGPKLCEEKPCSRDRLHKILFEDSDFFYCVGGKTYGHVVYANGIVTFFYLLSLYSFRRYMYKCILQITVVKSWVFSLINH